MSAPAPPPKAKRRRGVIGPPRVRNPAKPRWRRREDPHHRLQIAVKDALGDELDGIAGVWWTVVDHLAARTDYTVKQRKSWGVKPGIPRLLFIWRGRNIWIEMRVGDGSLSQDQLEVRADILAAGGHWHEARSVVQVQAILLGHGIPLVGPTDT